MDDLRLIHLENPLVIGQLTPLSIWFQTDFPLSNLAFLLEWRAWGMHPAFYHAVDIALHAWSALLVWRILERLKIRGAWLAGMLFAIHPVCVNSVARIAELKNTLSLPFFLLSLLLYLRYESSVLYPEPRQEMSSRKLATVFYTLSLLAFILSLFAKTTTVMLPVALLACAAWQRRKLSWRDLVHTGPHFFLSLSFGTMSIWFQKYQALAGETLAPVSFPGRLVIACKVFLFYLGKILVPVNLSIVYPRWAPEARTLAAFLPVILLSAAALVCWRFRRNWGRHALFGLGAFVILLFPALGFFDAQYLVKWQVSDHLQYLPLIAPIALVSAILASSFNARIYRTGAAAAVLTLFILTFHRAQVFSTQESLMRDTLAKNPLAADAHNDLGVELTKQNKLPEALAEFTAAAKIAPDNVAAQSNLGTVLAMQGNLKAAHSHFQAALRIKPFDPEAHLKLASVLRAERKFRLARAHLRMACVFRPSPDAQLQLADSFYRASEFTHAIAQFRQVIRNHPELPDAFNNLAWMLATCPEERVRNGAEAVTCAERACQLTHHKQTVYLSTLAAAYAEAGRFPEAIDAAETALRLQVSAGENGFAEVNRKLLEYYRAGVPFREQAMEPEAETL